MLDRTVGRLKWDTIKAILVSKCKTPIFRQNGEFLKECWKISYTVIEGREENHIQELLEPGAEMLPELSLHFLPLWRFPWRLISWTCQNPKSVTTTNFHIHCFTNRELTLLPELQGRPLFGPPKVRRPTFTQSIAGQGNMVCETWVFLQEPHGGVEVRKIPEDRVIEPEGGGWTDNRCPPRAL